MFTVIIAEKKHFDAIEQNSLFFKPFLEKRPDEIAFCEWIPEGQTLYESVPDLIRTVGRHKSWRAIVFHQNTLSLQENPFDFITYQDIKILEQAFAYPEPIESEEQIKDKTEALNSLCSKKEFWEKYSIDGQLLQEIEEYRAEVEKSLTETETDPLSEGKYQELSMSCINRNAIMHLIKKAIMEKAIQQPLQRLMTCFCYSLEEAQLGNSINSQNQEKRFLEREKKLRETNNQKTYLEYLELDYLLNEGKIKSAIREDCLKAMLPEGENERLGSMGISLPDEVYCFAERTTENGFFNPAFFWENHNGFEYADFVGRNMFFDKMRFIVMDILPESHQNYRYDRIRFLYNLLLFAANEVPHGTFSPRKLYSLESENNEAPLDALITSYYQKLNNTLDVLDGQIESIRNEIPRELSDDDVETLFCAQKSIPVKFNQEFNVQDLYAGKGQIGLAADCPENEADVWKENYKASLSAVDRLVKQPRRGLRKSVEMIESECEIPYKFIRAMNSLQMDDVRDFTEEAEKKMVSLPVSDIFNLKDFYERLDAKSQAIRKIMERRMRRKTTLILGLICLVLFYISFLPLIFTNQGDAVTLTTAINFSGIAVGVLAAVLLITLFFLRAPLKKALREYDETAKSIYDDVNETMLRYSHYLSDLCNVRRGYKVLTYSANNIDIYDRSIRVRKKHRDDIEKKRAFILDYYRIFINADYMGENDVIAPYDFDFSRDNREYDYTPPFLPEDFQTIEYLEKGNTIVAPSRFVDRVTIRLEEIYDL